MSILNKLTTAALNCLAPETAHHLAIKLLRAFPVKNITQDLNTTRLSQYLMGMSFAHPFGLAAGFDKDADVFDKLGKIGFSFVEIGTVTPQAQAGNPKPRLFRLTPEEAIINRYGFNSAGIETVEHHLEKYQRNCPIGINLGKNKNTENNIDDFIAGAEKLFSYADYFTINVSSPNTPGLRSLQNPAFLNELIMAMRDIMQRNHKTIPLFIKLSPDMERDEETTLIEYLAEAEITGLIISNTTLSRDSIANSPYAKEAGGLSGKPLTKLSTAMLARVNKITQGKLMLIGSGGVTSGLEAYEKLKAGARLLQIYTSFIFEGPLVLRRLIIELDALLEKNGVKNIAELRT